MVNRRELFPIDKVLGAHKILTIKILVIILLFHRVEVLSSRRWIHKRHCRFTLFTRFSLLYISLVTRRHKIPRSSCWSLHPNFSNTNRLCIMWASHGTSLSLRTTKIMVYIISVVVAQSIHLLCDYNYLLTPCKCFAKKLVPDWVIDPSGEQTSEKLRSSVIRLVLVYGYSRNRRNWQINCAELIILQHWPAQRIHSKRLYLPNEILGLLCWGTCSNLQCNPTRSVWTEW